MARRFSSISSNGPYIYEIYLRFIVHLNPINVQCHWERNSSSWLERIQGFLNNDKHNILSFETLKFTSHFFPQTLLSIVFLRSENIPRQIVNIFHWSLTEKKWQARFWSMLCPVNIKKKCQRNLSYSMYWCLFSFPLS